MFKRSSGVLAHVTSLPSPHGVGTMGKAAYDFVFGKGLTLQVNGGVQNVTNSYQNDFDKGWNRDSAYIYGPSLPRSFFAGMKFSY